jgi:hypothetical protein
MITFRLAPHALIRHPTDVIEVWDDDAMVATLYAGRDTGTTLALISKHIIVSTHRTDVVKDDLNVLNIFIITQRGTT